MIESDKNPPGIARYPVVALLLLLLALKIVYAFHFRIDDDEPQHLHVVWGWATGQLPYRDFFDNHGPIFHLLCSPLFRLFGERPDILIPMRLAMIPLCALSLWCIYRLGKTLFSPAVGLWAALFTGFYPEFFFTSTEFRTDDLWTVLWLLALVVATGGNTSTSKRALGTGLLLGTCFGITVKTGLMIGAVSFAAMAIVAWRRWVGGPVEWGLVCRRAVAFAVGVAVVPAAMIVFFAAHHGLKPFLYCNITHNLVPRAQNWQHLDAHLLWFPVFVALAAAVLFRFRPAEWNRLTLQRIFVALTAGSYFSALKTFFPTLSRQDDLPFIPLVMLFVAAAMIILPTRRAPTSPGRPLWKFLPPLIVGLEALLMILTVPFWHDNTAAEIEMVALTLRASNPGDYVMDAMGESIFRTRPFYYAIEAFTRVRFERGLIIDDIAERLVATGTAVVRPRGLTKLAKKFVHDNYIEVAGDLAIVGKVLKSGQSADSGKPLQFKVVIPGRYALLDGKGKLISGNIDGMPFDGPRTLDIGSHVLIQGGASDDRIGMLWADAYEKGFLPFK